jgi:hypothetical protein
MKGLEGIEGCVEKPHYNLHYKHKILKSTKESSPSNNINLNSSSMHSKFEIGDEPYSSTLKGSQQLEEHPTKVCLQRATHKSWKVNL